MRMTTSLMEEIFLAPPDDGAPVIVSLMELKNRLTVLQSGLAVEDEQHDTVAYL